MPTVRSITNGTRSRSKTIDLPFKVGDMAVYPAHGVGEVTSIEAREISGSKQLFYVLLSHIPHVGNSESFSLQIPVAISNLFSPLFQVFVQLAYINAFCIVYHA